MLEQESALALPRQATLTEAAPGRRARVLLLGSALLAAGCAGAAEVTGVATQQDLFQVRTDLAAVGYTAQRAKTVADSLAAQIDRRAQEQQSESERRNLVLAQRLEALASTLETLTARVDALTARVEALNRQAPGGGPPPAAASSPAPAPPMPVASAATPPPSAPPSAAPGTGTFPAKDMYQTAYLDFSKGNYLLAITGFRDFLRRQPDHELGGDAQYFIGEAYLGLARSQASAGEANRASESLSHAVREFRRVLVNYPRAEKVPSALYKEALALIDLNQPADAQARLQYLVDNFPRAVEASLARERLAALKR